MSLTNITNTLHNYRSQAQAAPNFAEMTKDFNAMKTECASIGVGISWTFGSGKENGNVDLTISRTGRTSEKHRNLTPLGFYDKIDDYLNRMMNGQ